MKTGRFLAISLMAGWPVFASAQDASTPTSAPVEQGANTAQHFANYFNKAKSFYEAGKYAEAFALLNPLALRGHADSVFLTGLMTYHGLGRPVDYTEAAEWFLKASDLGMARGRHFLGLMYRDGTGLEQNNTLALMWFQLAARDGVILSRNEADRLQKQMNAVEISQAKKLADTYLAGLGEVSMPDNIDMEAPAVVINTEIPPKDQPGLPDSDTPITLEAPEPAPAVVEEQTAPAANVTPQQELAIQEPQETPVIAPPAPVSEAIPAGDWAVQVGAFGNKDNVMRLREKLTSDGFAVDITDIEVNSRTISRVRVVNIIDRITADAIKDKIDRNYRLTSRVLRIN